MKRLFVAILALMTLTMCGYAQRNPGALEEAGKYISRVRKGKNIIPRKGASKNNIFYNANVKSVTNVKKVATTSKDPKIKKAVVDANALKQKVEKQIEEISKTETVTPLKTPSTPTPGKKDIDAVDENGFTELMHAAMIGDLARGEELLKAGADINTVNPDMFRDTALMLAIQFHQSKFANFLMENGADVNIANSMGITSLMVAAAVGDLTTALRLMKRGANLEAKSRNGHTAWDIAWKNGHFKVANAIENAANAASINAVDENGYTELMHAAMIGDLARGEELLKAGADINFVNPLPWQGDSALMIAIIYKQPEFADFLIENGIDVNIVNFRGQTALMYAAQEGYLPLVEKLTKKGANVNAADLFGNTAFKMARGAEVRDQLVKSGAK